MYSFFKRFVTARFLTGILLYFSVATIVGAQGSDPIDVLVRKSPNINGTIDGSLQMMEGKNVNFNGGSQIVGDFFVPGNPQIKVNGNAAPPSVTEGAGSPNPSNYRVTVNGGASLPSVVVKTDPATLAVVPEPSSSTGNRNVNLNSPSDDPGDFATLNNLTLNSNVGSVAYLRESTEILQLTPIPLLYLAQRDRLNLPFIICSV